MEDEEKTPLTEDEFEELWEGTDFKKVVKLAATGKRSLRYRRIVVESKVAVAQYEMVRWTKFAVLTAIIASMLSLVATVLLALTGSS